MVGIGSTFGQLEPATHFAELNEGGSTVKNVNYNRNRNKKLIDGGEHLLEDDEMNSFKERKRTGTFDQEFLQYPFIDKRKGNLSEDYDHLMPPPNI